MTVLAVVAAVVLLFLNGFFVGAEFAFVAARIDTIREMASGGNARAVTAVRDMEDLSAALAGAQLGITMASLGLGFVAEPAVADLIERAIELVVDIPSGLAHGIAIPIALAIVVYLHMVIGEMVPKNIAIAEPERTTLALALPFRAYLVAFRPLIVALNWMANGLLRLTGIDPAVSAHQPLGGDDLAFLVAASRQEGLIRDLEHRMLSGALSFSDRDVAEVMVPRNRVVGAPRSATPQELEVLAASSGHSRIPIYGADLDDVVGFVHAKDLLRVHDAGREQPMTDGLIRPMPAVPESARLDPVLLDMRRRQSHIALVVDEHGGTAGIVTLEDLIEEIVGEVSDEHDAEPDSIVAIGSGRYRLAGLLRADEVEDGIGVDLPEGDWDTLAGYLMHELGRIPEVGDSVRLGSWQLQVIALDGHRVDVVEAVRLPDESED